MTLKQAAEILIKLQKLQGVGGKRYKEINKILNSEATTNSVEEAAKMLKELNEIL